MSPPNSDTALPGFERSLAVVIGINAYSHGIPPLLNAVRDANAVADSLERQGFEVLRLIDWQASLSSLSHLIPALPSRLDRLLIYFAGHGLAHTDEQHQFSGFLLPSDARRDDTSSYWPMASLREALRHLPCRHLLLILDCCFAGAFPHTPSRDIRAPFLHAPLYLERFRHFSSRRSFQLLLSTAHDELASDRLLAKPSQESLGDGLHSPFALALLQALTPSSPADSNQDGLLTAAELYTFLRDRLLSLVPPHCQQTPSLWHLDWHDGGEFLFLLSDSFPTLPAAAPLSQHSNPYLGLRPFSSAHRHLFFGRERLVDSLLERLRSQPLLLLCGPSGAGKSSLVHAGLLPRLSEDTFWLAPPSLRPSSQPFQSLSSWLASLAPHTAVPSAADLVSQPRSAAEFLDSFLARHPEHSVLLVIDPLEELVTACVDDSLRHAFLRTLSGLLQLSHPRLHLLLLLRSDFEPHFLPLLQPSDLWHRSRVNLPPMNRDELRRCIEKPAEACVLFFSPGVVERLLDDVEQMPGALPLLSVALSELFDAYLTSGRDDRTLSFEDYHHIGGGIAGALQRRAELLFSGMPPPIPNEQPSLPPVSQDELPAFQRTMRNVLLRMVSIESGELARRRILRAELQYPDYSRYKENSRVQQVLSALEACRLVVASDDGGPCVEPAHDALLSAWPRLRDWARHTQRELLLLRRVSFAASDWIRNHRSPAFLWADNRLSQLALLSAPLRRIDIPLELPTIPQSNQDSEPLTFNTIESGFLRASAARQRLLRNRRYALVLSIAACILILLGISHHQVDQANRSATEASQQQVEARNQTNRALPNARLFQALELFNTDPTKALLVSSEAVRESEFSAIFWIQAALYKTQLPISSAILTRNEHWYTDVAMFSPDGSRVLTLGNYLDIYDEMIVLIWRADGSGMPIILRDPTGVIRSTTFSPDGLQVLTVSDDETVRIWPANGTGEPVILSGHKGDISSATFSPDGSHVLTVSIDRTVRIWRADGTGKPVILSGHEGDISSATFSPDGSRVLTISRGTARIWRADGTGEPVIFSDHEGGIDSATFSPDGSHVLTASIDRTARIWCADGTGEPVIFSGHEGGIDSATFSPDGSRVLTISRGTARIWRADGTGEPIIFSDHEGDIDSATFSPDGSRVLTISRGTARIWRADGTGKPVILSGDSATFSPDGSQVLTVSGGTTRIWRTDGIGEPVILSGDSATFSPDGSQVLTVSGGTAHIWRPYGLVRPMITGDKESRQTSITISPDGSHILTVSDYDLAHIWRVDGSGMPITLRGHTGAIRSTTFSPDGLHVLTVSDDSSVRIWRSDGAGMPIILRDHTGPVNSATFSPEGSRVLTTYSDTARIWRADGTGESVNLSAHEGDISSATFSPDGSRVLTISRGTARIWRADGTGKPVILPSYENYISSATFSPDGSRILTTSMAIAHIWRADGTGEPVILSDFKGDISSANFSPDGSRVLITLSGGTAHILRADGTGKPVILTPHEGGIDSATFSPDGSRVLIIFRWGTAHILRADGTGEPVILSDFKGDISSATFSPDGSRVLTTSSAEGITRIWHANEKSPPLILRSKGLSKSIFHPDGIRVVTLSDEGILIWIMTPSRLIQFLRNAITICLSANERERYLFESPEEALERYANCETSYGRLPLNEPNLSSKRNSTDTSIR